MQKLHKLLLLCAFKWCTVIELPVAGIGVLMSPSVSSTCVQRHLSHSPLLPLYLACILLTVGLA